MKRLFVVIFLMIFCMAGFAQPVKKAKKLFDKAKKAYYAGNVPVALTYALQAMEKDSLFIDPRLLLSDIYSDMDSIQAEISQLSFVFNHESVPDTLVSSRLSAAYFSIGDYKKCLDVSEKILTMPKISLSRKKPLERRINDCRFALNAILHPVSGEAIRLGSGVNTDQDEYWPSISIDGKTLVFTRLEGSGSRGGYKQEDIYMSEWQNEKWAKAVPVPGINTDENEGAQTISADGQLMFFTACNRADGMGSCDIYFSRKAGNQWMTPRNAGPPVSTGAWESQPSLTANADYLYFVSNRKGGKGGMDIWRCRLKGFNPDDNPIWGQPENLGDSINTPGDELSPYIHFNGTDLYFSSDYHIGMGKKDIFHSRLKNGSVWSFPNNLGYPVNTMNDEVGFVIDATGTKAYYASNREGNMDIYTFNLYPAIQPTPVTYVKGVVRDAVTKKTIQAEVEFTGLREGNPGKVLSGQNGEFLVSLPLKDDYAFDVSKDGYLFYSRSFNLKNVFSVASPFELDIYLQPVIKGSNLVLRNIYFNTDSYELLPESGPELNKLKMFLVNNPGVSVEIDGHTDNVGSMEYNLTLSEKRAEAVCNYLISSGIAKERLTFKGFGYSRPVADNNTEEGRSLNRRTEVVITDKK